MRRFAGIIGAGIIGSALTLAVSAPALAEDVVIRIEAKRGAEAAAQAARGWGAQFPDVVTFPLSDGWVGIALGPMPRDQAAARLEQLKSQGQVPGDSFLSAAAGRQLTPVNDAAQPEAAQPPAGAGNASTFPRPAAADPASADTAGADPDAAEAQPAAAETAADPVPAPPQFHIRLESTPDRAKAEQLLADWRQSLPEAALWTLPNGRSAIAIGPVDEAAGKAWLRALRNAGLAPKDAFLAPAADMGDIAVAGDAPRLPAPPSEDARPTMPPLEEIQRALRWAGHYDGAIDGKDGPMTQKAIAEEIVRLRASPDPATAMAELIRRRGEWRAQMGLTELRDDHTGLALPAPMNKLQFDRNERALSIYGPRDGSGAALILFSQPGGRQEMLDLTGLVTALGWVPSPQRSITADSALLKGRNDTHIGQAETRIIDGQVQGFVLIWPASDAETQARLAAEMSDGITRISAPAAADATTQAAVDDAPAPPAP
ncbi:MULTISPECIES: peptidoglycan-binding domain-containing protein [unclassified Paracoccus (in: a-proteobacteria)]|uniref:peptidoglycan-binding domain-containing protein n=1 Tax=unclassified Paracoccus (in: a-proteobacteria) TaxID=2688777 RepID=UPI0021E143C4|nr:MULTISPECIES: peptidoglycan-binding domain-containing protein [unclassified Paracoccus (in: a-proteobacteria)]UXU75306.1 peptidoglycan-binding protein [Paracoccus sp. SMMA_5]UXU81208.1 peptidoglycan-binding protein [Paracoccus sp. SMMA_5_TC]